MFRKVIQMDSNHLCAQLYLAKLLEEENVDEGRKLFEKIIKEHDTCIDAYIQLGLLLKDFYEELVEAKEMFEAAIKIDPENMECWMYLEELRVDLDPVGFIMRTWRTLFKFCFM